MKQKYLKFRINLKSIYVIAMLGKIFYDYNSISWMASEAEC